jgi:hypothetical protein
MGLSSVKKCLSVGTPEKMRMNCIIIIIIIMQKIYYMQSCAR